MSFQAPSLPGAEPPSACVSGVTSINNTCGGNTTTSSAMSSMAPPPAKHALQEAQQLPRTAASVNRSEFSYCFHLRKKNTQLHSS
jgi:hypothetical protein